MKVSDYASSGDSVSLAKLGENSFTIIGIEDSDYDDNGTLKKGVKITTKEKHKVNVAKDKEPEKIEEWNKFHTTRQVIVKRLSNQNLRTDVNKGEPLKVKCVTKPGSPGKKCL